MVQDLIFATLETLYMTLVSALFAILLGIPLGIALYMLSKVKKSHQNLYSVLDWVVNIFRSIIHYINNTYNSFNPSLQEQC